MPIPPSGPPEETAAIRRELERVLNFEDDLGRTPSNAKYGVYAFFDYDGEPIYVGQTAERLRTRIRRHLTNQRTDAVAMNVLDPFEVAEVEMWPLHELEGLAAGSDVVKETLARAEYTAFTQALAASAYGAVLNEKEIPVTELLDLPASHRARIVPDDVYERRKHPDIRIARRATTIAALARVISERQVSTGLRHTLLVQAQRLELLARQRLDDVGGVIEQEAPGEETGDA